MSIVQQLREHFSTSAAGRAKKSLFYATEIDRVPEHSSYALLARVFRFARFVVIFMGEWSDCVSEGNKRFLQSEYIYLFIYRRERNALNDIDFFSLP